MSPTLLPSQHVIWLDCANRKRIVNFFKDMFLVLTTAEMENIK